jgi:hypothetical protein
MIVGDFRHLGLIRSPGGHKEIFPHSTVGVKRVHQKRSTLCTLDSGCPIGAACLYCRGREALCKGHIYVECLREGYKSPKRLEDTAGYLEPLFAI